MALMRSAHLLLMLIAGVLLATPALAANGEAELLAALREGRAAALMRHATAPGTGDPAEFQVDDCATQRNLSAVGREQARATGARLRAAGITSAEVYSSQWCRCLETARLLDLGEVLELPALNSFFGERARAAEQSAELAAFLRERTPGAPLILVTHQVNISAFTDAYMRSGEIVVVALPLGAEPEVLGRIAPLG
jgi:broad specificity phosphatase PhoE